MSREPRPLLVFGTWIARDGKIDEAIPIVSQALNYARNNPDDVPSLYVLEDVLDEERGNEVRTVTWFKDEEAYQRYLNNSDIVSIKVQCENKRLLQTAQSDRICHPIAGFIRRPEMISDPFVIIASVRFKPGERQRGFEQFGEIAKAVKVDEPEAYTYVFSADTHDAGLMWNFERYSTEKFLREIHIARDDLKRNRVRQENTRQPGGLHHYYWKQIAEFQAPADLEL